MERISEPMFRDRLCDKLSAVDLSEVGSVIGPGRSGAIASVYASHILGVPFIPWGGNIPERLGRLLIIDTARESGATLRKAERRFERYRPIVIAVYEEPPRVMFWYEAAKPQRYRHEFERSTAQRHCCSAS